MPSQQSETTCLVTGGAGFIGGCFVRQLVASGTRVVNLDLLTYAGNLDSLGAVDGASNYAFVQADIGDASLVTRVLQEHEPTAVVNFRG